MTKILTAMVALGAIAGSLVAQSTNLPTATNLPTVTNAPPIEVLPPPPGHTNKSDNLKPGVTIVGADHGNSHKPDRPDSSNPGMPADVKNLVERFQKAREDFIAQQKASHSLPRGDQVSEQQRQEWLEKRMELREEFRKRLEEIRSEFRNRELNEVLDAAKDAARRAKPRVGED